MRGEAWRDDIGMAFTVFRKRTTTARMWTHAGAAIALALAWTLGAGPGSVSPAWAAQPAAQDEGPVPLVDLPSGRKGLRGLREAPDIPVDSIILRRAFPDHPVVPRGPRPQPAPGERPGSEPAPGREPQSGLCDVIDLEADFAGVKPVAAQDNLICSNADIDSYANAAGSTYVVQAGGDWAAWTHTDVSDPANLVKYGPFCWVNGGSCDPYTYTPDVKAFRQGNDHYIAMGLERLFPPFGFCGVVIVKVTDPAAPVVESQFIQDSGRPADRWCDVHNVFVEKDAATGEGKYIYVTADNTNDLRVLDISGEHGGTVTGPKEIGRYKAPGANTDNYVHDVTMVDHGGAVGRRVYLAYWDSGLVILNAADVTPGTKPTPIVGPNVIDPPGFLTHHAFPTHDGAVAFVQDEFLGAAGDEPVQMWSLANGEACADPGESAPCYVDGLMLNADVPANPAHNLEIRYDIHPDRLYVGWYKLGLRAWNFTANGFTESGSSPQTSVLHHRVQTDETFGGDEFDGAWGVRLAPITTATGTSIYVFQSDRYYGLIVDCLDENGDQVCDPFLTHDVAVTGVTATPSAVTDGDIVDVVVDLENLQESSEDVEVTLTDETDGVVIGMEQIALTSLATDSVFFAWDTMGASNGSHTLVATASLLNGVSDVDLSNNSGSDLVDVTSDNTGTAPTVTGCNPTSGSPGDRIPVTVSGSNFVDGATADFGNGVAVQKIAFNTSSELVATIKIHPKAAAGPREVTITNPDGQSGSLSGCFAVN